ncbi:MAG: DUF2794 domain-containing protein [Kiloniellales bacterium]
MALLYRFNEVRRPPKGTFFDRRELNQLLSLYSRRVSAGEWRDYAIDPRPGSAVFSVFRHTHDAPAFTIAKERASRERRWEYVVLSGRETLIRASTMSAALSVFERHLRVVS